MLYADRVFCNNCENTMKVVKGTEVCPKCKCRGALSWVDDNAQEVPVNSESDIINYHDRENVINGTEKSKFTLVTSLVGN